MVQASNATTTGAGPEQRTKNSVMSTTLIGAHGLEHMYGHSFPVLVTALYENLGLDPVQAGLLSAVRQLSSGATSMASGFFVDMFQHRSAQLLAFSMALLGIGYLLVALSPTYSLILAALVIASAGSALWHPPALGLLSQRFPERRGLFISLHRSSGNVGDMIGPLIAGGLLAWLAFSDSWRWILGGGTPMLFVLALLILAILWNVAGPRKEQAQDFKTNFMTQLVSLRGAFRGVGMWAIFTVSAVRGMADRSVVFFLPFYLRQELEMGYWLVGAHVTLIAAPGIVSGPLFGALSDRIGRKSIIIFVMAITFILPIALVMSGSNPVLTLTVVAVFGLFHSVVNSLTQAAAIDEAAGRGLDATFIGLMWGSNAFFGAGIALVAGFLVNSYGWVAAFYFASALFFLGFLASLLMPRPSLPRLQAV
jgi:MFS family permease